MHRSSDVERDAVRILAADITIEGDLVVPAAPSGLVIFAHGSGSSRFSRRNRIVADALSEGGFATLLLDLLTREEEVMDQHTGQFRFDIERLAARVTTAIDWSDTQSGCLVKNAVRQRRRFMPLSEGKRTSRIS